MRIVISGIPIDVQKKNIKHIKTLQMFSMMYSMKLVLTKLLGLMK